MLVLLLFFQVEPDHAAVLLLLYYRLYPGLPHGVDQDPLHSLDLLPLQNSVGFGTPGHLLCNFRFSDREDLLLHHVLLLLGGGGLHGDVLPLQTEEGFQLLWMCGRDCCA